MATEEAIVQAIAPAIKGAIAKATQPLLDRNEWLEKRLAELEERLATLPLPERGAPGNAGPQGEKGDPGRDGQDGIGLAAALIDSEGNLAVTNSRGDVQKLGRVVGRDGHDGARGPQGEKGEPGEKGDAGKDGESASIDLIRQMISEEVSKLPRPEKGEKGDKGDPGRDADVAGIRDLIQELVRDKKDFDPELLKSLMPAPIKGEKGDPGRDGKDGQSVTLEDVAPVIRAAVAEQLAELPKPEKGERGEKGEKGDPGRDGKDGVGVKTLHVNHSGELVVTLTDDIEKNCGVIVGPEGPAGADGRDGFGFDDFRMEFDGERRLTMIWEKGEARREKAMILPIQIARGVYEASRAYERGDLVTYGGSQWVAMKDAPGKPKEDVEGWQLTVKRGRDGKDGKGEKGEKGDPGRPGRDLTQVGPDGSKW